MSPHDRRAFLAEVGRGMLVASVGAAAASELGLAPLSASEPAGRLAFGVVVNKEWWDGLPADVRATLEQTMKEATDFDWSDHKRLETEAIDNIRAAGKTPYEITDARQATTRMVMPSKIMPLDCSC